MQEDAARMVADSLRISEAAEAMYREEMRDALAALNEMRGPQSISGRTDMVRT